MTNIKQFCCTKDENDLLADLIKSLRAALRDIRPKRSVSMAYSIVADDTLIAHGVLGDLDAKAKLHYAVTELAEDLLRDNPQSIKVSPK